jgi:hypothetical protein
MKEFPEYISPLMLFPMDCVMKISNPAIRVIVAPLGFLLTLATFFIFFLPFMLSLLAEGIREIYRGTI